MCSNICPLKNICKSIFPPIYLLNYLPFKYISKKFGFKYMGTNSFSPINVLKYLLFFTIFPNKLPANISAQIFSLQYMSSKVYPSNTSPWAFALKYICTNTFPPIYFLKYLPFRYIYKTFALKYFWPNIFPPIYVLK